MFIASCQIKNYKGFLESERINLTPGFDVIVGPNNAGKTALTEALSLQFQNKPHRSLTKKPEGASSVWFSIKVEQHEIFNLLRRVPPFLASMRPNEEFSVCLQRINRYLSTDPKISCVFENAAFRDTILADLESGGNNFWAQVLPEKNEVVTTNNPTGSNITIHQAAFLAADLLKQRIYIFHAERLNIHHGTIGTSSVLNSDARNLPEVLHYLQSSNRYRFQRFVEDVRTVFPDIQDVAVTPVSNNAATINIWFVDPKTERKDLAVPLSDCGTGIGQVLAMLYVVINSDEPRTILIDEPQSFLHPGAIRKLFEIFKRERNQKHQYIITTHSPTVVTACSPCNLTMLYRQNNETHAKTIDVTETAELRLFLSEVGARLSDVFGADRMLWVEGRTEELCYRLIAERLLKIELLATEIIGVLNVGDLMGRHKKAVFQLYQKLCEGRGLLPPALGFCFDRENLSETEMAELTTESKNLIQFIPRRMYESYLLNSKAIALVLNDCDTGKSIAVTHEKVEEWLAQNRLLPKYIGQSDHDDWLKRLMLQNC